MTSVANPIPPQDFSGIVGHRFIYTYANGWQYEMYVKNATTIDYRIHLACRWPLGQGPGGQPRPARRRQFQDLLDRTHRNLCGGQRSAVQAAHPRRHLLPQWIRVHGERTVCYQNEHLDEMRAYRDQGPTYPIYEVPEFAYITLFEYVGPDDETVIDTGPDRLPPGWSDRTN